MTYQLKTQLGPPSIFESKELEITRLAYLQKNIILLISVTHYLNMTILLHIVTLFGTGGFIY